MCGITVLPIPNEATSRAAETSVTSGARVAIRCRRALDTVPLKQQWPGSRRTLGRDPGHRNEDQPASVTGESASVSVARRVRTAGIANAATAPSPTTTAPIQRAGVIPSTNVWSVA